MATEYNLQLTVIIPAGSAPSAHQALLNSGLTPAGERFFNTDATHIDPDGNEYVLVKTWGRPHFATAASNLVGHFPGADFAITAERIDGAVVKRDDPPPILESLSRITPEENIL